MRGLFVRAGRITGELWIWPFTVFWQRSMRLYENLKRKEVDDGKTQRKSKRISLKRPSDHCHCAAFEYSVDPDGSGSVFPLSCWRSISDLRDGILSAWCRHFHDAARTGHRRTAYQKTKSSIYCRWMLPDGCSDHHFGTGSSGSGKPGGINSEQSPRTDSRSRGRYFSCRCSS